MVKTFIDLFGEVSMKMERIVYRSKLKGEVWRRVKKERGSYIR